MFGLANMVFVMAKFINVIYTDNVTPHNYKHCRPIGAFSRARRRYAVDTGTATRGLASLSTRVQWSLRSTSSGAIPSGSFCGNKPIAVDTIMATECACVQAWWRVCAPGRCVCAPSAWFVRAGVVRVSSACVRTACACVMHGWLCTSQSVARV